jgi:hypothetical protein
MNKFKDKLNSVRKLIVIVMMNSTKKEGSLKKLGNTFKIYLKNTVQSKNQTKS